MFEKRISPFACVILVFLAVAVTFVGTTVGRNLGEMEKLNAYRQENSSVNAQDNLAYDKEYIAKISQIIDVIENNYIRDFDDNLIWENMCRALAISIGDKYAQYFTAEEYDALINTKDGDFVGIGVHASYDVDTHGVYIFGVMPMSPAESCGIQKGDVIVAVEGTQCTEDNYYNVLELVRGESGTTVNITVSRDNEKLDFTLTRAAVASENVIYENLGDGIAYIRILSFSDETLGTQFATKIALAQSAGCTKFVFDVRNNSGGYLEEICKTLDILLPEGPIINMVDKNGTTTTKNSDANCIKADKMVVLCNTKTASAAELFTAALRDYDLAEIVGTKTFGKGSMQTTYSLSDGSAIKFSTALYNPPSNVSYDGIGIEPDYVVELPEEWVQRFYKMPIEQDVQLQKALEILSSTN